MQTMLTLFSLGLFLEITNRLSCVQHIHVHTPSGDQCQPRQLFQAISRRLSVSSYQSEDRRRRRKKRKKAGERFTDRHLTSFSDSSLRLPLSCRIYNGIFSPHSHILVSLAAREAVSVRIWYNLEHLAVLLAGPISHTGVTCGKDPE